MILVYFVSLLIMLFWSLKHKKKLVRCLSLMLFLIGAIVVYSCNNYGAMQKSCDDYSERNESYRKMAVILSYLRENPQHKKCVADMLREEANNFKNDPKPLYSYDNLFWILNKIFHKNLVNLTPAQKGLVIKNIFLKEQKIRLGNKINALAAMNNVSKAFLDEFDQLLAQFQKQNNENIMALAEKLGQKDMFEAVQLSVPNVFFEDCRHYPNQGGDEG